MLIFCLYFTIFVKNKAKPFGNALFYYTKLVFLSTSALAAPSPTENIAPPRRQRITFIIVEERGVIIDTIIKRSIPPPSEPQIESHVFDFAATLIMTNIGTNTSIRQSFASMHEMIL